MKLTLTEIIEALQNGTKLRQPSFIGYQFIYFKDNAFYNEKDEVLFSEPESFFNGILYSNEWYYWQPPSDQDTAFYDAINKAELNLNAFSRATLDRIQGVFNAGVEYGKKQEGK